MSNQQRTLDWWMWLTLLVAVVCFILAAAVKTKPGADFMILFGAVAMLAFFLRMYYRRSK